MKTLTISALVAVSLISCTKKESVAVTPSTPITSTTAPYVGHWQYAYDSCKKLVITADSFTTITCVNSVTQGLTTVAEDTVILQNGVKCILHVVGDTLWTVPQPYNVWSNKYYRY